MTDPHEIPLSKSSAAEAIAKLRPGEVVYLEGHMYTSYDGILMRVLENRTNKSMEPPSELAVNFHCPPTVRARANGWI